MEEIRLEPYEITVATDILNRRAEPNMSASIQGVVKKEEKYIVQEEALDAENNSWGKLEDGSWIKLAFTERKPRVQEDSEEIHE